MARSLGGANVMHPLSWRGGEGFKRNRKVPLFQLDAIIRSLVILTMTSFQY